MVDGIDARIGQASCSLGCVCMASLHLELLSLGVEDLYVRDALLVSLLKLVKLLGCCLPQLQGLQALLGTEALPCAVYLSLKWVSVKYKAVQTYMCRSEPAQTAEPALGGFWWPHLPACCCLQLLKPGAGCGAASPRTLWALGATCFFVVVFFL